jgi:serine/threonine-protein kinase
MGEVYRADDLKLGQTVALKFLPKAVERDEARLSRFLNEVKIARQISHTNVCRVYDVGEVEGHHFISMEFVDGEDLAALLRRIDRLPRDKAVEIARQLCAGLAAAHDQGVLHRDLKPANVMIDGRGKARITDFGLAELAIHVADADSGAGTPAYMAPEQLAGKAASVKTDLYSLGLVLYELFTGRRAFSAASAEELVRLQQETTPTSPASHVEGFDPAVERVILRCLQKNPADRPGSALSVAAALPGGDPLAAALAAGETPSPELAAEAGEVGGLSQTAAWVCVSALVLGTLLVIALSGKTQLVRMVPLAKPPVVMAERAREIAGELGYSSPPEDTALGYLADENYLRYVAEHDPGVRRWDRLSKSRPPAVVFWYRESPTDLSPRNPLESGTSYTDPPALVAGMWSVALDPEGRLQGFQAVPPERDDSAKSDAAVDWSILLKEAGLDPAALKSAEPLWTPATFADQRAAWEGTYLEAPEVPLRIEAAAYRGKPVAFRIIHPWTAPAGTEVVETSLLVRISQTLVSIVIVAIAAWSAGRRPDPTTDLDRATPDAPSWSRGRIVAVILLNALFAVVLQQLGL